MGLVTLPHELGIAKELASLADDILSGTVHADTEFTRKDYIFFGLADKNFVTFDAIRLLAEKGFADDAFGAVRTLAECTVNAAFVGNMPEEVANDYADFTSYMDWKELEGLGAVAPEVIKDIPAEEIERMRKAFEAVKKRYEKNRPMDWCSKNLFQRASEIDKAAGGDSYLLRTIVNLPWRKASAYVHGTAKSIASRIKEQDGGIVIHRVMTAEEAAAAMYAANLIMFAMLAFVDLRLSKKHAKRWQDLHEKWAKK